MKIVKTNIVSQFIIAILCLAILYLISDTMLKATDISSTFSNVILMVFFIALCGSSKKFFWFIIIPMCLIYALYAPIGLTYGEFSYDFLISGISTDLQESKEFISQIPYYNYVASLIILIGIFIYKYWVKKYNINFYRNKTFLLCAVIVMLSAQAPAIFPKQIIKNVKALYIEYQELQNLKQSSLWENVSSNQGTQYDNYVLIIGESARKDYHHAYGYPIENTNFMSKSNGILINGLTSGGWQTITSLRAMLTLSKDKNWNGNYSYNVIDLINKAGFTTYWLSNQGYFGIYDTPISALASQSKNTFFARYGSYDTHKNNDKILLEEFSHALQSKSKTPKFIVLHLYGSHENACSRITENDLIFKKIDYYYSYLNCYISTIKQTDNLLEEIYSKLEKTKKSFSMIYFADHGLEHREIGDRLYFNNSIRGKLNYDIPLFKVSSDDSQRKTCNSFKSALNFTNGLANWLGISADQLDKTYNLFDCQDDPDDYGLSEIIQEHNTEPKPAVNLLEHITIDESPEN